VRIADRWRRGAASTYSFGRTQAGSRRSSGSTPTLSRCPAIPKLTGRMFIRETSTSVPLMFVRVPPYVSPKLEQFYEWQERVDMPVQPVIFRFDPGARPRGPHGAGGRCLHRVAAACTW
jgi:hypothetical protein